MTMMNTVPVAKHVPVVKDMSRREFFFGVAGGVAGGAVATATGLGAYYWRKRSFRRYEATKTGLTDSVVRDDGWMITEEDRTAIAAARAEGDTLVETDTFELLEGVDYYGGDVGEFRASSLGECVEACEADASCKKFTYATSTHDVQDKRQMCWMKGRRVGRTNRGVENYISGKRR